MIQVRDRVDKASKGTGFLSNRARLDSLTLWEECPLQGEEMKKWEKACPKLVEEGGESCFDSSSEPDRHTTRTRHNGFDITAHHHRCANT